MPEDAGPLVEFQSDGRASVLTYNIPDSTSYGGQGYIDLDLDPDWFKTDARGEYTFPEWVADRYDIGTDESADLNRPDGQTDDYGTYRRIREAIDGYQAYKEAQKDLEDRLKTEFRENGPGGIPIVAGTDPGEVAPLEIANDLWKEQVDEQQGPFAGPMLLSLGQAPEDDEEDAAAMLKRTAESEDAPFDPSMVQSLQPRSIAGDLLTNKIPLVYTGFSETASYEPVPAPTRVTPRLMLVEEYRVSTFLGDYGAGRTLKTFSLLPGEKTTISIKTFKHRKQVRKEAQSILESKTSSAAQSFEQEISRQQWNKQAYQQSKAYTKKRRATSSSGGGTGFNLGIVKGSGGQSDSVEETSVVSGASKRARASFAKSTMNAVRESSSRASSKREVDVNTSREATQETRYEKSVEREIENVNLSRTLNFVFRQLNQEFITVFHLENVRVAYADGTVSTDISGQEIDGLSYREVPLWKLDELLSEVIVEERRDDVRTLIRRELENIVGYDGKSYSIVSEEEIETADGETVDTYLRVDKGDPHEYRDPRVDPEAEPDRQPLRVPGVILDVDRNRLRTDGVIVEALLGKGEALGAYSQGLQAANVKARQLENEERQALIDRRTLANSLVADGSEREVERYQRLFDSDDESFNVEASVEAAANAAESGNDREER
jgi:hypothetical protein